MTFQIVRYAKVSSDAERDNSRKLFFTVVYGISNKTSWKLLIFKVYGTEQTVLVFYYTIDIRNSYYLFLPLLISRGSYLSCKATYHFFIILFQRTVFCYVYVLMNGLNSLNVYFNHLKTFVISPIWSRRVLGTVW